MKENNIGSDHLLTITQSQRTTPLKISENIGQEIKMSAKVY